LTRLVLFQLLSKETSSGINTTAQELLCVFQGLVSGLFGGVADLLRLLGPGICRLSFFRRGLLGCGVLEALLSGLQRVLSAGQFFCPDSVCIKLLGQRGPGGCEVLQLLGEPSVGVLPFGQTLSGGGN